MTLDTADWEDPLLADLRALGKQPPTGLSVYEAIDPVEAGAPDLPPEVLEGTLDDVPAEAPRADEFVCSSCFLTNHRSQRSAASSDVCLDCA